MTRLRISLYSALAIWFVSTFLLASQVKQTDFPLILTLGLVSFGCYFLIIRFSQDLNFSLILSLCILIRILLLPTLPLLSDDFYRFIWDGKLWHDGYHPFVSTPQDLLSELSHEYQLLFDSLNSPAYRTIYPPIAQLSFVLACFSSSLSWQIIFLKLPLLLAEVITFKVLWRLLSDVEFPKRSFFLYALNPLVIVEIMGNIHHEGLVICFLALFLLMLRSSSYGKAAVMLAASVATKLTPLLFLPYAILRQDKQNRTRFLLSFISATALMFGCLVISLENPFLIVDSLGLYLRKFEFNGGLYYLLRSIGYMCLGYNLIHLLGPLLAIFLFISTLYLSWHSSQRRDSINIMTMICIYMAFLLLSPTVHPWYILPLVFLGSFTKLKSIFIWSMLILFSYSRYGYINIDIYYVLVAIEYLILACLLYRERYDWRSLTSI